jgi:predicted PurR-regulated permease PerM
VILTIVTIGFVLYILQPVLVPLVLAVFISAMLLPLLDFVTERPPRFCGRTWCRWSCGMCLRIERKWDSMLAQVVTSVLTVRLPNALGLLVVLGVILGALFGVVAMAYVSIESFIGKVQYYQAAIESLGHSMPVWVTDRLNEFHPAEDGTSNNLLNLGTGTLSEIAFEILLESEQLLVSLALTMLYTVFMLMGRQDSQHRQKKETMAAIEQQLKTYITWKFIVSGAVAVLVGVTLHQLKIDLAALFAILTFLLNFIPTVGLLIAVLLPIPLIYLAPGICVPTPDLPCVVPDEYQVPFTNKL